ncbi:MAG: hypothetical protein AAF610_15210 [Pseudomonadota bacterium]
MIAGTLLSTLTVASWSTDTDRAAVERVLAVMDDASLSPAQKLGVYESNAVIMAPDAAPIRGHKQLLDHLTDAAPGPGVNLSHFAREITRHGDLVVAEGGVRGEWRQTPDSAPVQFATNNLILLRADDDGRLKVWKVVYNAAPVKDAQTP